MSNVLGSHLFWASTLVPEYGARALVAMHGNRSIARILSDPTPYDQHDQYGDLREHDGAAGLKPPDIRGGESCQDRYKPHGGARNTCLPPTTGDDKCAGDWYCHHRAHDQGAYGARCDGDGECAGEDKAHVDKTRAHAGDTSRTLIKCHPKELTRKQKSIGDNT